jgi:hypothetical protein
MFKMKSCGRGAHYMFTVPQATNEATQRSFLHTIYKIKVAQHNIYKQDNCFIKFYQDAARYSDCGTKRKKKNSARETAAHCRKHQLQPVLVPGSCTQPPMSQINKPPFSTVRMTYAVT